MALLAPAGPGRRARVALERLQLSLQFAASVLRLPWTRVYRCVFNDEATSCSPVGARHAMANGIALRGNMIYVVDVLRFSVTVYERRRDGSLVVNDTISLPHAADNVYALPDGSLLLGSMPRLHQCLDPLAQKPPVAGALTLATPRPPSPNDDRAVGVRGYGDPRWTFRDTSCARTAARSRAARWSETRALVGSPWDRGALLCELDEVQSHSYTNGTLLPPQAALGLLTGSRGIVRSGRATASFAFGALKRDRVTA